MSSTTISSIRSSSSSSSTRSSNNIGGVSNMIVAAAASVVGMVVGLVLSPIVQRFVDDHILRSRRRTAGGVHAVRAGLFGGDQASAGHAIRIPRNILDDFVGQILVCSTGCSKQNAQLVANVLSYADSRGIPSHGVNRLDTYINEIQAGLVNAKAERPREQPVVERISGCCAVVDGKNGLGAVTAKLAMETAIQLAQKHGGGGVAVVTCHSSNHYGAAGYWAKMALDKNYIGMSFTNTSPIAVPTRSRTRGLGTNPFCFFAPAAAVHDVAENNTDTEENDKMHQQQRSFQLDMATTTVPIGKIEVMDRIGKSCPKGWGVDGNGNDTTNPKEICQCGGLYPLGGPEERQD